MRLLWVISNWKRTGPVEPSLDLAAAVQAEGHDVQVLVGRTPDGLDAETGNTAAAAARARGLTVVTSRVRLGKHRSPIRDWGDGRRMREVLEDVRPDVVTTTLPNALRLVNRARPSVPVAYLSFDAAAASEVSPRGADLIVSFEAGASAQPAPRGAGVSLVAIEPALDIERLAADVGPAAAVRAAHGVADGTFLFGIVARMQTHRRFELLWDAMALLKGRGIDCHLFAIGRGTNQESVAFGPVRALGLDEMVTFPGYLRGADYVSTLAALDAQIFLVPGSDPTCRALREGMALGVPSVVTARGMLPRIVLDGETGTVVASETPEAWADALAALVADPERTRTLGAAAASHARDRYAAPGVARSFLDALAGLTSSR